jgi:hypothetical protein
MAMVGAVLLTGCGADDGRTSRQRSRCVRPRRRSGPVRRRKPERGGTGDVGAESYAGAKAELGTDTEPVDLGDEAFHAGDHLFVRTGDTVVPVQVERRSIRVPSVEDAALEEAATAILDALGG